MGRNQYGITDEDIKKLRDSFVGKPPLTPEERAVKKASAEATRARDKVELNARRKKAREEKKEVATEQQRLQKERFAEAIALVSPRSDPWDLHIEPIDPHFGMEHSEYLQTPLWRKIRRRVLKRDGGLCQICSAPANEVHHRSYEYEVIVGKDDEGCISLCAKCHERIEFTPEGEHRSVEQKEAFLLPLLMKV